jgi:hypothetical protein
VVHLIKHRALVGLIALLIAFAAIGALWFSPSSMVVTTDSIGYLGVASNLTDGRGVTSPFALQTERASPADQLAQGDRIAYVEQPPGYPAALAATQMLGLSPLAGARLVSVGGVVALALAAVGISLIAFGRSKVLLVATTTIVVVTPPTVAQVFQIGPITESAVIMSERLFLPLMFLALLAISLAPTPGTRAEKIRFLIVLALVAAVTSTRYLGVAVGMAAAMVAILDTSIPLARRLTQSAAAAFMPALVILVFSISGGGAPKLFVWHSIPILAPAIEQIATFFRLPSSTTPWLRTLFVGLVVLAPLGSVLARTMNALRSGRNPVGTARDLQGRVPDDDAGRTGYGYHRHGGQDRRGATQMSVVHGDGERNQPETRDQQQSPRRV